MWPAYSIVTFIFLFIVVADGTALADDRVSAAEENRITKLQRTGKERLAGKASDEQRVDNCKIPPDLRGDKARPDSCPETGDNNQERRQSL